MFRVQAEAVSDARWRISLAINFVYVPLLTSVTGTSIMQGHAFMLAIGKGYLLPAQWVNRGMSFPTETIRRLFLHLLSHVQECLEK